MSLEDLTQYAPAQTDAINRLIHAGHFTPGPISSAWTEFKESVWRTGIASLQAQEPVERDDDPVDDDDLVVPTATLVAIIPDTLPDVWHPSSQRILVRSDYYEAEITALSASEAGKGVFLATGHPGNGSLPSRLAARRT